MTTSADREAIERWFVRRGVPQFIDDYRATTNVWTRAFPVLVVLCVAGIGTELGLESEFGAGWSAVLVAVGIVAVLALLVGDAVALPDHGDPTEPPLNRGQRTNMLVLALTTQAVQITVVSSVVWAFFVLLGLVAVHPDTVTTWIGTEPDVLFEFSLGESTFALTEQLLRVAAFLAVFSGLAFTVYLVTDQTYREEFRVDVADELRQIFAVRLAYRELKAPGDDGAP